MIFNVNFKTLSGLIKSAFVGVWTLRDIKMRASTVKKLHFSVHHEIT